MLSLILTFAVATATSPPAAKPAERTASGCSTPLQLASDAPTPSPQPAPCPKPYLMAGPGAQAPVVPPKSERMPNLFRQPTRCGPVADEIVRRVETATRGRMGATYAVMRSVDGCGVPTPIRYHPDYLLPGAADPVRREGAPADRR
jgi:hypothetical protein